LLKCVVMTLTGFLSGSVMYAYLIPKLFRRVDIRQRSEDGNPGVANVFASSGIAVGAGCLVLDLAKAFVPVFISVQVLNIRGLYLAPVIVAPVLGHAFSPFLWFKGGKAVAASVGALLGSVTVSKVVVALLFFLILFKLVIVINPDSAKSILAYTCAFLTSLVMEPQPGVKIAVFLISLVVCYKHYVNPNKGDLSIAIWRYSVVCEDKKFKFIKS